MGSLAEVERLPKARVGINGFGRVGEKTCAPTALVEERDKTKIFLKKKKKNIRIVYYTQAVSHIASDYDAMTSRWLPSTTPARLWMTSSTSSVMTKSMGF
jgi:hypothetical protein